jgi:dTDP-4-amino-4,6-dideoxygalactose transaminase
LLSPASGANHWLTVAVLSSRRERDKLLRRFEAANIEARPVWKPLHLQPVFAKCRVFGGEVAEALFERGVCLPNGTGLKSGDFARIAECLS